MSTFASPWALPACSALAALEPSRATVAAGTLTGVDTAVFAVSEAFCAAGAGMLSM